MKKNDLLTLTADGLGADLEGVCRADGMAVFVPGMLPGETARVRIVKVQSRFAFGRMEGKPLTASPARKTPDCAAYPRCGGCTGRHMTYETTLEAKRQQVQDCFRRIGHIDIDVPPVLGMADPSHYRNKTALPVGGTVEEPVAGFFAPRSHDIIPIAQCPNAMPPADEICRRVLRWMKHFHVEPYVEETHTGLVRHIVVRVNRKGEAMAVLVINGGEIPHEGELVASLKAAGAVSVILNENRERTNVIMGRHFHTLYGCDTLTSSFAAYAFAKLHFKGRDLLFVAYIATIAVPWQAYMLPQFIMMRSMGLYDTLWAMIVLQAFSAFGVFLMRQFYQGIPTELCEAARIDGLSEYGIWAKIMLPLSTAAIATLVIFTFVGTWNDYMGPMIYLTRDENKTIQVGLRRFIQEYTSDYHLIMAASLVSLLPVSVVFLCLQKYFIEGIATSGLKG